MITAKTLTDIYISFFEKRGHKIIPNSSLVPENDPSTLFTSSGMQPLVPYLLGETHPQGKRLVNVQNCFRAQDIDEVGDNRHTTFFRMLGNWSLGDYFKKEQLPYFFGFLTEELKIDPHRLYVSVFDGLPAGSQGNSDIPRDEDSAIIWKELFTNVGIDPENRIFYLGAEKNWWSRSGPPQNMPPGEPGGPDSEVFYDFADENIHNRSKFKEQPCGVHCDCGRYLEIGNSVFMQYQKLADGSFRELPQKNVDFGGGLERQLAAVENQPDIFQTNLLAPIVGSIEKNTGKEYKLNEVCTRIIIDHFVASSFMILNSITPSNKEQGYILRRLIRRGLDNYYKLEGKNLELVISSIVTQYKETDPDIVSSFEKIKNTILEEEESYKKAISQAKKYIFSKYKNIVPKEEKEFGDELKGVEEISSDDAFILYSTHGLSPAQIKSLGFIFNEQEFAEKMKEHQVLSRKGAEKKFAGGLEDQKEKTVMGHTATHLLHRALKDVLGLQINQAGSNINEERLRFDFTFDRKPTEEEIKKVEDLVNQNIKENLPITFEIMNIEEAQKIGAVGLFNDKYGDKVKVYFIGGSKESPQYSYSIELCGGPHVGFTGKLKSFKIIKEEGLGRSTRRIYAKVG